MRKRNGIYGIRLERAGKRVFPFVRLKFRVLFRVGVETSDR